MSNTVPSRLAMKLARYCSSSARFRRQKAARTRKAERATRNLIGSPPHRSVLTNAPTPRDAVRQDPRSEEHTSELQSRLHLVCRLLLEKKKITKVIAIKL